MIVAIQDANIIINLISIDLLTDIFNLQIEFHSTDFVTDELNDTQKASIQQHIDDNKLIIQKTTYEQYDNFIEIQTSNIGLSITDCSVFQFAISNRAILLTGDRTLRNFAVRKNVEVHGILWLFDQLVSEQLLDKRMARAKLERLMNINDRLPINECHKRLEVWI